MEKVADRLLTTSAAHASDPTVDIDWQTPLSEDAWYWQPERISLYGTPLWQRMDQRQRLLLSRSEAVNALSTATWLEFCLIRMLARHLSSGDFTDSRSRYALVEIGEETRHSLMFAQLILALGSPAYRPPATPRWPFEVFEKLLLRGPSLFALTLVGEEVFDRWQRATMADERVQSLIRQVCRFHVIEESRHVRFARTELSHAVARTSPAGLARHRQVTALAACLFMSISTNPEIYRAVGLDPDEAGRQARRNPHFRRTTR
ncbi:diiron oxygenase [Streptomyces sp. NPDC093546]|uniref:AurF N-oxygenase family protein n=1 Tax=Streptomyces sp. NPDC093546 TaxID=3366040 RepID=UPI00381F2DED